MKRIKVKVICPLCATEKTVMQKLTPASIKNPYLLFDCSKCGHVVVDINSHTSKK